MENVDKKVLGCLGCGSWKSKKIDLTLDLSFFHKILAMFNINLKLTLIPRDRRNNRQNQHCRIKNQGSQFYPLIETNRQTDL